MLGPTKCWATAAGLLQKSTPRHDLLTALAPAAEWWWLATITSVVKCDHDIINYKKLAVDICTGYTCAAPALYHACPGKPSLSSPSCCICKRPHMGCGRPNTLPYLKWPGTPLFLLLAVGLPTAPTTDAEPRWASSGSLQQRTI